MISWAKLQCYKFRIGLENPGLCQVIRRHYRRQKYLKKLVLQREALRELRLRRRIKSSQASNIPAYLTDNSWEQELNYKLWITKGARFAAARRCENLDSCGLWSTTILSSYLIIVGLIPYIPHPAFKEISPELLGFGTTALSIILMAVTLLISSRQYPLQAKAFHECSLKIAILYDRLRQAKEIENKEQRRARIAEVTNDYEELLPSYSNHEAIDQDMFKIQKSAYFKLKRWWITWCYIKYYGQTKAMLHIIIAAGVIVASLLVLS